jgi:hypothetical protein
VITIIGFRKASPRAFAIVRGAYRNTASSHRGAQITPKNKVEAFHVKVWSASIRGYSNGTLRTLVRNQIIKRTHNRIAVAAKKMFLSFPRGESVG